MAHAAKKPVHGTVDHVVFGEIKDAIVPDLKDLDALKLLDRASERMQERDVSHRDISLSDILLSKGETENGERHGLLIDLDYAVHRLSKGVAAACHRAVSLCVRSYAIVYLTFMIGHVPLHGN